MVTCIHPKKEGVRLDTTKLVNPSINYLPYVFSSLRNMKGGDVFELVSKRPFNLSDPMKGDYETEVCYYGDRVSTKIVRI
jgi:uncharacterized protein YqjF (DUF2071 family)